MGSTASKQEPTFPTLCSVFFTFCLQTTYPFFPQLTKLFPFSCDTKACVTLLQ
uniref:Uncharacterized protein n=1 Tax=Anguilla anguilla TaxID=7936 RepID=A0A0E9RCZ2_ANGAN